MGGWIASSHGYFRDCGYGYQWWSARAGDREFSYASGHGGQGAEALVDYLLRNGADGIHYGQGRDYDGKDSEEEVIRLLKTGLYD